MNDARTNLVRTLCALAMGALCLAASGGDPGPVSSCPNYGVQRVPAYQMKGNPLGCSLPEVDVAGVKVKPTDMACFSYITDYPERDISVAKAGYYTRARGVVTPVRTFYRCRMDYWLFIPLGRLCVIAKTTPMAPLQDYMEIACGTTVGGE